MKSRAILLQLLSHISLALSSLLDQISMNCHIREFPLLQALLKKTEHSLNFKAVALLCFFLSLFCFSPLLLFPYFPLFPSKSPFPEPAVSWQYLEVILSQLSAAVLLTCLHQGSAGCSEWVVGGVKILASAKECCDILNIKLLSYVRHQSFYGQKG